MVEKKKVMEKKVKKKQMKKIQNKNTKIVISKLASRSVLAMTPVGSSGVASHRCVSGRVADKTIRHRACALRDTAHAFTTAELDPEFESLCQEIVESRRRRGQSGVND